MSEHHTDAPAHQPKPIDTAGSIPAFDLDTYLEKTKDFDMSEVEQRELLMILWDIMRRFVELGFGLDSVSLLSGQTEGDDHSASIEKPSAE
ncbi:MAG: hypothetical protein GC152_08660 [Alphaproteobacteria bacterium]|nr:hypothetical protein [Alphaproteobacteria bacterium]